MSRFLFLLFFFIYSFSAFSQDTPATIYFNDGESVVGYGSIVKDKNPFHIPPEDKIAFRLSRNDKADLWDGEMVESIVFHFFEHSVTYIYVDVIFGNKIETYLLQLIAEGEVNLYSDTYSYWEKSASLGTLMNPSHKVERTSFMVKRNSEGKFASLNSKKKIIEYFKDCPGIATKLNKHEFSITDLEEIINYYNDYCSGYDFEEEAGEEETIETEDLLGED